MLTSNTFNDRELRYIYLGKWPHHRYYAGESVTLSIEKDENMNIVITATDIELGNPTETEEKLIFHFVMPDRDVHIDYDFQQIYLTCPACGKEYEKGENVCPHCKKPLHKYAEEIKTCGDFICDGVLAWGVEVGRFVFEKYGKVVYSLTDTPHIGASDVCMCYQISRTDYEYLLTKSQKNRIPEPSVPAMITNMYHDIFLCSESAYAKRNEFTLSDVKLSLCEDL